MPTFIAFKDSNKVGDLVGAVPQRLEVCLIWVAVLAGVLTDSVQLLVEQGRSLA